MVYECRNNHATFSAAYCPTCDAIARAEAAEATLASCNRARQAAEAECERLREQVAQAKADGANEERSLHWMSESVEVQRLREQVATLEIDHEKLLAMVVDLQDDYSNALKGAYIAEAKVSDLNEQVATLRLHLGRLLDLLDDTETAMDYADYDEARSAWESTCQAHATPLLMQLHDPNHRTQPRHFHSR